MKTVRKQRGAILVLAAIFIPVILGITALALDVGRIMAVRSEMQNAVDAAALAAAAELDGTPDAQDRARAAARELVEHDSRFASVAELLGSAGLPDEAFTFYCIIGSKFDPEFDITFCDDNPDPDNADRYLATSDQQTHYVRVQLDPALVADHFQVDLFFLPVLSVFGIQTADVASISAAALGGRNFYFCDVAPIAICDPWEGTANTFETAMTPGQSIEFKQQGANQWSSGNFGFLEPFYGGSGASAFAEYLADEYASGEEPSCSPPLITTQPGNIAQKAKAALNTRFDEYGSPNPFDKPAAPTTWPPAENVVGYTLDTNAHPLTADTRFGGGTWDFAGYWAANHPGLLVPPELSSLPNPTRKAVYDYEIANSQIPTSGVPIHASCPPTCPDPQPPDERSDRRVIRIAVLSCAAAGLTGGKKSAPIFPPDGVAQFFLLKKAGEPYGDDKVDMYGEYVGWEDLTGGAENVQIQLFD